MQKQLHDGLILRSISEGHASDRRDLPRFFGEVFQEAYSEEQTNLVVWTESLLAADHPATTDDDVWLVVDPAHEDRIVSAMLLIPQTWRYESVRLGVGRVEIVATHKDYRRRGLIRELIQVAHERSASLGHTIQVITGIPHYYRRFGYTMAVDLGGFAAVPLAAVPKLAKDKTLQYTLRPATEADIPNIIVWEAWAGDHALLSTVRSEAEWHYEFTRPENHMWWLDVHIITHADGRDVGYVALRQRHEHLVPCLAYIVGPDASYLDTYEDVLRGLKAHLEDRYPQDTPAVIHFAAGMHEAFNTLTRSLYPAVVREDTYAWYVRAPSLAHLIREIAPVLEQRLHASGAHGYNGTLKISFFNGEGLLVRLENGCIADAEDIAVRTPQDEDEADAAFPWHSFLSLVFGHRTYDTLKHVLPECHANGKAQVLLEVMFPRGRSWLMPLA